MLRTKLALSLASLSLALSASCGGGSGGGSQIDIEDFCAENTGAFSQFVGKLAECTPELEIIFGGGTFRGIHRSGLQRPVWQSG